MPSSGPRAKHWCFTLNNYTQQDVDRLANLAGVDYLIFGKEVGASGTPHLQGYVAFQSRKRLQQCIQEIGQAHFSITRMIEQSIEYCKKDGDFIEIGTPPKGNGKRCDLEEFKQTVREGVLDLKELRELHSTVCARYPMFVRSYVNDLKPKVCVDLHPLMPWQANLNGILILPPHPREIIFVVDTVGNQGKSWFCRYYSDLHDNCQIILPGKKADMAFTIDDSKRVFLVDAPRSKQGEFVQYDFLEELKNGMVFSPKYESIVKKFKTPHVVVMMNEEPDMNKLSNDRYNIIRLTNII